MGSGEMLIELGASWFSAKAIKVVRPVNESIVGKALENFKMKKKP